jgi:hypothetical protein
MPKFDVYATVKGSRYIGEFDAENEDEAIEMAARSDRANINLCHQCSPKCENAECDDFSAELLSS